MSTLKKMAESGVVILPDLMETAAESDRNGSRWFWQHVGWLTEAEEDDGCVLLASRSGAFNGMVGIATTTRFR
ncbi:hypothetical protein ACLOJK_026735 [Asimina triloba]